MRSGMRFPLCAALVVGVLLPALETLRRGPGHWLIETTTMLEDYVAGALLIVAAITVLRRSRHGPVLLVLAWGYVTGLMSSSFWDQLETALRGTDVEPYHGTVLAFKGLLWTTALVSLVLSVRAAMTAREH
jgi:hypothetical protein